MPGRRDVVALRAEYHEHRGPLPDAKYFRELAKINPDAPRIILEDFQEQARHRRSLEKLVTETNAVLARRSQIFAFTLGLVGLTGSFIVVGLGFPVAGTTIATGCVVSLVTVFLLGRERQKRERVEKERIREQMRRGDPIEKMDEDATRKTRSLPESSSPRAVETVSIPGESDRVQL